MLYEKNQAIIDQGLKKRKGYSMGIRTLSLSRMTAYEHAGAWGNEVAYIPAFNASIALVATQLWSDCKENILRKVAKLLRNTLT